MLLAHTRQRFDSISAEPYFTSSAASIDKVQIQIQIQILLAGWGPPSILGLRPRLTATWSKIPTRYCSKVGHSGKCLKQPLPAYSRTLTWHFLFILAHLLSLNTSILSFEVNFTFYGNFKRTRASNYCFQNEYLKRYFFNEVISIL